MFTLIGASSDSASVPTFGSRINRVEVSHGNLIALRSTGAGSLASSAGSATFTSNRIPSKPPLLSLPQGGILKGFRSRCAASKGADSEATAVGGFTGTEAGSRLTGWIEINRFKVNN